MNRLKRGAWIVCKFKTGLGKRRGYVFGVGGGGEGGVEIPMNTMNTVLLLKILTIIDT